MADTDGGTRWLTYAELAATLGIKRDSAIRLVRRKPWPKRRGNGPEGIRVGVPADILEDKTTHRPPPDIPSDTPLAALQAALASLDAQLKQERERGNRAEQRIEQVEAAAAERETWLRRQVEAVTAAAARPPKRQGVLAWFRGRG